LKSQISQPLLEYINGEFSDTLYICFEHPESSVRQRAGQVISLLIETLRIYILDPPLYQTENGKVSEQMNVIQMLGVVDHVITNVLMKSMSSLEPTSWCSQEIKLVICEEVIRHAISQYLSDLKDSDPSIVAGPFLFSIKSLILFLKNVLKPMLSHQKFEIRRVASQVIIIIIIIIIVIIIIT
jgi:hypothetical protein